MVSTIMKQILATIKLDAWISLFLAIMSICLLTVARKFPGKAALFPNVLLFTALLLCIIVFIQSLWKTCLDKDSREKRLWNKQSLKCVTTVYCLIVAYFLVLETLGFIISTMVFVSTLMLYLGERNWLKILCVGIGINVFVYSVFILFLKVPLPLLPALLA